MAARKKTTDSVISLDTFGSAKNYWLCWVKSSLPHLSFANTVQKRLNRPCAYIGSINLEDIHPELKFPMYFSAFSQEYDINLVILSNKTTAPISLSMEQQNPLFGGLLFEDDYYLFNNQGLTRIQFSYPQADYILMLSAGKCLTFCSICSTSPSPPSRITDGRSSSRSCITRCRLRSRTMASSSFRWRTTE